MDKKVKFTAKLIQPNEKYLGSYLEACEDFEKRNLKEFFHNPNEFNNWKYNIWETLENERRGINLPEGWVPSTTFWLVEGDSFIGRGCIRHRLTPTLEKLGGHIGYAVAASKWNQGYGTKLLELLLDEAGNMGLSKVLVTCSDINFGSIKVIENNGGILQDKVEVGEAKRLTRRYWFNVKTL
ncbi:MAG: GNAT family N-acetyltransferase [Filifactoraceae bacterium]